MQLARFDDLAQVDADRVNAVLDQAPVKFELTFAGPAEEPRTTTLALQVSPTAHETAFLIGQMREFDL